MATLKHRPAPGPVAPDAIPLVDLLSGDWRPGSADREADRRWVRLRHEVLRVADAGGFDPRTFPPDVADWPAWLGARYAFLARAFASDPRVRV